VDVTIRPITSDEVPAFLEEEARAFGADAVEGAAERFLEQVDLSRTSAAFDGDTMIGTAATHTFDVTIPGDVAPMGGLAMVSVRPSHTRRGVLRSMMRAHFDDVMNRDELLSGLWASESSIYGRFGYGSAIARHDVEIDVGRARLRSGDSDDVVRMVPPEEAARLLPDIYEQRRLDRSGMLSRSEAWWRLARLLDLPEQRGGASSRRYAIALRGGSPVGYVTYRQRADRSSGAPSGSTSVVELIGDGAAQVALWKFLASIDLFPDISWWNAPVDDPISWMAADVRGVSMKIGDSLWVRPMDVIKCLERRRYRTTGRLVLGVSDGTLPGNAGNYRLVVDTDGVAMCERTPESAEVSLDVAALGGLYMGGRSAKQLAWAGLVTGSPEAVRLLDELMAWDPPWCPEAF
jgi:predicted acetyltransferase